LSAFQKLKQLNINRQSAQLDEIESEEDSTFPLHQLAIYSSVSPKDYSISSASFNGKLIIWNVLENRLTKLSSSVTANFTNSVYAHKIELVVD
jgi:hypothetical protein